MMGRASTLIWFVRLISDRTNPALILWLVILLLANTYEEGVRFVRAVMMVDLIQSSSFMSGNLHFGQKLGGECEYIAQVHH